MRQVPEGFAVCADSRAAKQKRIHVLAAQRDTGAIGIMVALLVPVFIAVLGLSIELGRMYNRKAELQSVADAMAIAAAQKLDGTGEGITAAVAAAKDVMEGGYQLTRPRYAYSQTMVFSETALKFAKSRDDKAEWLAADTAKTAAQGVAYVQVDTDQLNEAYGTVELILMQAFSSITPRIRHVAVAGKPRLGITPLAICDMSLDLTKPLVERKNPDGNSELSEYGFRRGVSYDLMQLNPGATSPGQHYLVDPIILPPKGNPLHFDIATVGPYVCTGMVELPSIIGKTVNVQAGFPLDKLYNQLNSRFDKSNGLCDPNTAPPDSNIKQYAFSTINWMDKPLDQVAKKDTTQSRLQTIADLLPGPANPNNDHLPGEYGPLWVFARAVPWSQYEEGKSEPFGGYAPYNATTLVWKSLYSTGPGLKGTYPSGASGLQSPYFTQLTTPTVHPPGVQYRRVLNIPLLRCPATTGTATVVGIAKFFMTIPADANHLYAEFAGMAAQEPIAGPVELNQ